MLCPALLDFGRSVGGGRARPVGRRDRLRRDLKQQDPGYRVVQVQVDLAATLIDRADCHRRSFGGSNKELPQAYSPEGSLMPTIQV